MAQDIYLDKNNHVVIANVTAKFLKEVPSGVYTVADTYNALKLAKIEQRDVSLFLTNNCVTQQIIDRVDDFIEKEKQYHYLGIAHKLGIILHGASGTGKTSALDCLCRHFIKHHNGLVIKLRADASLIDEVENVNSYLKDKPIIFLIEDIDTNIQELDAYLCEILDGLTSIANKIFITITNDFNAVPARLIREGRLSHVFKFELPDEDFRRQYLTHMLTKINKQHLVEELVIKTEGYTSAKIADTILKVI